MNPTAEVQCPTCFEWFEVPIPPAGEQPASVDYDCEVCCRPMVIHFEDDQAVAHGLDE